MPVRVEPMMVTTSTELPGYRVVRNFGIVRGIIVRSRSLLGSIGAGLQTIIGGMAERDPAGTAQPQSTGRPARPRRPAAPGCPPASGGPPAPGGPRRRGNAARRGKRTHPSGTPPSREGRPPPIRPPAPADCRPRGPHRRGNFGGAASLRGAAQPGALAPDGQEGLAVQRNGYHAGHDRARDLRGDADRPVRQPVEVVDGAVERVDIHRTAAGEDGSRASCGPGAPRVSPPSSPRIASPGARPGSARR